MRLRIPVWTAAVLAILASLLAGGYAAYVEGTYLQLRERPEADVQAPRANLALPLQEIGAVIYMTPQQYAPQTASVSAGQAVRFENAGSADLWPDNGEGRGATGVVPAGESWYATFQAAGTYRYRDRVFPNLGATVVVR